MLKLTKAEVERIKVREQARKTFIRVELEQLAESLKVRQLQPILIDSEFWLIFGQRRLEAAKIGGLKFLDAYVTDEPLTPTQVQVIQLTENLHRADLTPFERWQGCKALMELNPAWQLKDLAAHLKLDPSSVSRLLSPSKCIPAVQEAFEAGALGLTDVYAISKAESEQEQHEMLAAKFNGASRDDLERVVRCKRNGSPAVKVTRLSIPFANGLIVTVAGERLGFDETLSACTDVVREGRKAQAQGLDVKTWARVMADKAKGVRQ